MKLKIQTKIDVKRLVIVATLLTLQLSCTTTAPSNASTPSLASIYTLALHHLVAQAQPLHIDKLDTLFIHQIKYNTPNDFPDIQLPKTINNVPVVMVPQSQNIWQQPCTQNRRLINMIGWVDSVSAVFAFVIFEKDYVFSTQINSEYSIHGNNITLLKCEKVKPTK